MLGVIPLAQYRNRSLQHQPTPKTARYCPHSLQCYATRAVPLGPNHRTRSKYDISLAGYSSAIFGLVFSAANSAHRWTGRANIARVRSGAVSAYDGGLRIRLRSGSRVRLSNRHCDRSLAERKVGYGLGVVEVFCVCLSLSLCVSVNVFVDLWKKRRFIVSSNAYL